MKYHRVAVFITANKNIENLTIWFPKILSTIDLATIGGHSPLLKNINIAVTRTGIPIAISSNFSSKPMKNMNIGNSNQKNTSVEQYFNHSQQ